ncbi:hypothetical protein HY492_00210 [Candidatus Woesearchaeota archaeon]|nr:hypothetical protein [Candidatus Woesearchaeota archaeon]
MKWFAVVCAVVPLAVIITVYALGIRNQLIIWLALLLCPVMHIAMHYLKPEEKCH